MVVRVRLQMDSLGALRSWFVDWSEGRGDVVRSGEIDGGAGAVGWGSAVGGEIARRLGTALLSRYEKSGAEGQGSDGDGSCQPLPFTERNVPRRFDLGKFETIGQISRWSRSRSGWACTRHVLPSSDMIWCSPWCTEVPTDLNEGGTEAVAIFISKKAPIRFAAKNHDPPLEQ